MILLHSSARPYITDKSHTDLPTFSQWQHLHKAVLWMCFFRIRILFFSWFRIRTRIRILLRILHEIFLIFLTNFNFVSRLVRVLGCILWRDISFLDTFLDTFTFLSKSIYIFLLSIFVEKFSNFFGSVFRSSFSLNSFQIRNDYFPDPYPYPAQSFGSYRIRIRIHNTCIKITTPVEKAPSYCILQLTSTSFKRQQPLTPLALSIRHRKSKRKS